MRFTMARRPASLCETCVHLHRITDTHGHVVVNMCRGVYEAPHAVPMVVRACTTYGFKFEDAPNEMQEMAWVMERRAGRVVGFRSPEERKKKEGRD